MVAYPAELCGKTKRPNKWAFVIVLFTNVEISYSAADFFNGVTVADLGVPTCS